ncbi:unnamed protein product [Aphanomyces euteiches]
MGRTLHREHQILRQVDARGTLRGCTYELFGINLCTLLPAMQSARRDRGSVTDNMRLPKIPAITSNFPSMEERSQLQDIAEQSCRYLKHLAYTLPDVKENWESIETDTNMELYLIKDKNSDTTSTVCGVTGIHASLTEVADSLVITGALPDANRRGPQTFVDEIIASKTLMRVDMKTSIKWMALKSSEGAFHRDFVVLHTCDHFQEVETSGVVIMLHSLDFPGAPPSFEMSTSAYPFIRGGIYRSGIILLENNSTPGLVDVVSVFKVDFKGSERQNKIHRNTLQSWTAWMGYMNKYVLCEKLRRVGAPRVRHSSASLGPAKARSCESCEAPFKFKLRRTPKSKCLVCGAVLCSACTVEYEESTVNKMVFCMPCIVKWNPDGPSIKFIQPVHLMQEDSQIKLRSQMHRRFDESSRPAVPKRKQSIDSTVPMLGDDDPPSPQHNLQRVHEQAPQVPNLSPQSKLTYLRRQLHEATAVLVRESTNGNKREAKKAMEQRKQLLEDVQAMEAFVSKQNSRDNRQYKDEDDGMRFTQARLQSLRLPKDGHDRVVELSDSTRNYVFQHKVESLWSFRSTETEIDPSRWRHSSSDVVSSSAPVLKSIPRHSYAGVSHRASDDARTSDIQIFTDSDKRVDVGDLHLIDDIHSFAL